ncbi:hypothetical protein A5712_28660 [Mycobacterium sp. E2327]|uniref:hypothetical protein n=1 Tax=Mycobacterium sp. E2327 TaxID=1834132 RepID=UPI0007FD3C37|nr:hypothetical protein [Mycobacterium sp. E2327]OBI15247.1 hypothetical protein A5712_28660 [Mycobacterium sp. E2327]
MLIIALVLALIGLVALVFAVVTSNELVAWVCIGASVLGVVLLIIDALRERQRRDAGGEVAEDAVAAGDGEDATVDYPEEVPEEGERPAEDTTVGESSQGLETSEESAVPAEGRGEDRTT